MRGATAKRLERLAAVNALVAFADIEPILATGRSPPLRERQIPARWDRLVGGRVWPTSDPLP